MTDHIRRAGQVAWAGVGIALLLAIAGWVAWSVRVVFPPLVLAGAIVFILNPVVTALQHRGFPRAVGALLTYLGIALLIVAAVFAMRPVVGNQIDQLRDK